MTRSTVIAAVSIGCGASSKPPPTVRPVQAVQPAARPVTNEAPSLLRVVQSCPDIRNGWSGYQVFEVIEGPATGTKVVAGYGEEMGAGLAEWAVGRVTLVTYSPSVGWPNSCGRVVEGLQGTRYDGGVGDALSFATEAEARHAFRERSTLR